MKQADTPEDRQELSALCNAIRELVGKGAYQECEALITAAMGKYPHAPQPHNLIGILLEKMDDHVSAMKHFRAAWSLDPTYLPTRCNLDRYASFYPKGICAFDEMDCPQEQAGTSLKVDYDKQGIGHIHREREDK